ncbi:hypothetical protein H9Y04_23730 [Streptomyces sp. TRM66268-LWL]|uniref:Uncharacterized protein n=1 Tax=Streptomyces polyasparticus TaxID=2767826 RepID=A0ABR7SJT5_9ACTN|nr:hypothetical protein [Streptomyces polyasparticus]MBC9715564.1 hypothetical protein [Streptomyces polyasparticus]
MSRTRKAIVASVTALAAAGIATGASGAFADDGGDTPKNVRIVVDERGSGQEPAADKEDCPGKGAGNGNGTGTEDPATVAEAL